MLALRKHEIIIATMDISVMHHSELSSRWRHNECDGVSNDRRIDCFLNPLFRRRSKKISKIRVTGLCEGNSPVTGEFLSQRAASNAENVSIWWRHHKDSTWKHISAEYLWWRSQQLLLICILGDHFLCFYLHTTAICICKIISHDGKNILSWIESWFGLSHHNVALWHPVVW